MKIVSVIILLTLGFNSLAQFDSTKLGIDAICQTIDSKKEQSSFTFHDTASPLPGKSGYTDVNYTYVIENKSDIILYIKVWRKGQDWYDQFYFLNGNLIKATITGYSFSPTTRFYLWNNRLVEQEPSVPLFWKGFNQLGYSAYEKVKAHIGKHTSD